MMIRIFTVVVLLAATLAAPLYADVKPGDQAPDFTLKDTSGKEHKLSNYKGKTVVLEWTNQECPFVIRHTEAKTMLKLAAANPDVVWLAIDSTSGRPLEANAEWIKKEGIPYPILSDSDGSVGKLYGAKTTPHMFVIAPDGKVVYAGAIDNDRRGKKKNVTNHVATALDELKAGKPVSNASTKPYGCSVKY